MEKLQYLCWPHPGPDAGRRRAHRPRRARARTARPRTARPVAAGRRRRRAGAGPDAAAGRRAAAVPRSCRSGSTGTTTAAPYEALLREASDHIAGYLVTESLYTDYGGNAFAGPRTWPDGERSPGVVMVTLLRRPARMSATDWITHWHTVQSPVSEAMQPRMRYVRNAVARPVTPDAPPIEGIVEEAWPSPEHMTDPMLFYCADGDRRPHAAQPLRDARQRHRVPRSRGPAELHDERVPAPDVTRSGHGRGRVRPGAPAREPGGGVRACRRRPRAPRRPLRPRAAPRRRRDRPPAPPWPAPRPTTRRRRPPSPSPAPSGSADRWPGSSRWWRVSPPRVQRRRRVVLVATAPVASRSDPYRSATSVLTELDRPRPVVGTDAGDAHVAAEVDARARRARLDQRRDDPVGRVALADARRDRGAHRRGAVTAATSGSSSMFRHPGSRVGTYRVGVGRRRSTPSAGRGARRSRGRSPTPRARRARSGRSGPRCDATRRRPAPRARTSARSPAPAVPHRR